MTYLGCILAVFACAVIPSFCEAAQLVGGQSGVPEMTVSPRFNPDEFAKIAVFVESKASQPPQGGVLRSLEDEFSSRFLA